MDVDELYALPVGEFVPARNALAAQLRRAGEKERANEVKALRRPTVAAWALNQLARRHRAEVEQLAEVGVAARAAQHGALSGSDASALREVTRARRALVEQLSAAAARILTEAGISPAAHAPAIRGTLDAASLDEDAVAALRTGRLDRELDEPSGFGEVTGLSLVKGPGEASDGGAEAQSAARARRRELERAASEAERLAVRAQKAAESASREVEELERKLTAAKARADDAARDAREARQAADAAGRAAR